MTNYNTLSDTELLDLLKPGDSAAYTEIYNRYAPGLMNHAYNKTRSRDEAKDILHDVFSMLWAKREILKIKTNLSGFLYTSVRNKIINNVFREVVKDRYIDFLLKFVNESTPETDHRIRERQLMEQIEKEIFALPPKMREAFEMSRNLHLSHKQIAIQLGITEANVSQRISSALGILKVKLRIFIIISWIL